MLQPHSLKMQNATVQSLKQTQRMIMSPQMQQAIRLLQVPIMELTQLINLELEQNPILEYSESEERENFEEEQDFTRDTLSESEQDTGIETRKELDFEKENYQLVENINEDYQDYYYENENYNIRRTATEDKLKTFLENSIQSSVTLHDYLLIQSREYFDDPEIIKAAEAIIFSLDEKGFFTTDIHELSMLTAISPAHLQEALAIIQTFDPIGIAAINLQESLIYQLKIKKLENSLAYLIIRNHFDDLLHNKVNVIVSSLNSTNEQVSYAIENIISKLDLHPGLSRDNSLSQPIVPDIHIFMGEKEKLEVRVNDEFIPNLKINIKYLRMIEDPSIPDETKEFIKKKIHSAKWLMKSIFQRNSTLERIGDLLIKTQFKFLTTREGLLEPMTMKVYAEELQLHESTIARAISNKYLACERGIFPLRYFFTSSIGREDGTEMSSKSVKQIIGELISEENKLKPFSDQILSRLLKNKGIHCARRTIAKYRNELNVGNAHQRKKFI